MIAWFSVSSQAKQQTDRYKSPHFVVTFVGISPIHHLLAECRIIKQNINPVGVGSAQGSSQVLGVCAKPASHLFFRDSFACVILTFGTFVPTLDKAGWQRAVVAWMYSGRASGEALLWHGDDLRPHRRQAPQCHPASQVYTCLGAELLCVFNVALSGQ